MSGQGKNRRKGQFPSHRNTSTVLPSFPPWTREGTSAAEAPRGRQCVDEHKVIGSAPSSSSCHSPLGQLCSLSRCLGTNSCIPASTAAKRMGSPKPCALEPHRNTDPRKLAPVFLDTTHLSSPAHAHSANRRLPDWFRGGNDFFFFFNRGTLRVVKGGGGLGRKENKARDSSLVFERRALWACSVFISLRRQHRSSQKNISKQVSFQPSPRRRRALGCQGGFAQPPASLGYLRLSPSPSSCFCPEPAGRAQLPDKPGRVGRLRVAPAAPEPLALRTGAQFSRTKCGWHGAGGDNLPGWTLGLGTGATECSRPHRGRSAAAHHPACQQWLGASSRPRAARAQPTPGRPSAARRRDRPTGDPEARGPTLPNQCFPEPARRPSGGAPRWLLWTVPPTRPSSAAEPGASSQLRAQGEKKVTGAPSSPPSSPPPALCPGLKKRRSERYANTKQIGKAGKKGKLE
ncbi:uncharacterized protein LOC110555835 [Meriones unguiculatus]|uniref:uncharacterized protein LOC110555835 n=1 Tax=Meriones unguiculatus TaxID=10047 RepID=UPI00293E8CC3|nr:uncharacterized protein LOC110555835 [Meriones unguiculatus]